MMSVSRSELHALQVVLRSTPSACLPFLILVCDDQETSEFAAGKSKPTTCRLFVLSIMHIFEHMIAA